MARGPLIFTQRAVTRALRGAAKAGFSLSRVEIDRDGKIVMITGDRAGAVQTDSDPPNEWDAVK
jgi:hypothetical protein